MTTAEACLFGRPLGFPVDTTTRAARRACSEPRFPVRVEEDVVRLKDVPIQFLWKVKVSRKGKTTEDEVADLGSPERNAAAERSMMAARNKTGDGLPWDPHKVGFGPLPDKFRRLPSVSQVNDILGKIPSEKTRGGGLVEGGDGECQQGGEENDGDFPPPSQRGKGRCANSSPPSQSAANPKAAAESSTTTKNPLTKHKLINLWAIQIEV